MCLISMYYSKFQYWKLKTSSSSDKKQNNKKEMDFIHYFSAKSLSPIWNSLGTKVPALGVRYFLLSRSPLQLHSISNVHVLFHQSPFISLIYFINNINKIEINHPRKVLYNHKN